RRRTSLTDLALPASAVSAQASDPDLWRIMQNWASARRSGRPANQSSRRSFPGSEAEGGCRREIPAAPKRAAGGKLTRRPRRANPFGGPQLGYKVRWATEGTLFDASTFKFAVGEEY